MPTDLHRRFSAELLEACYTTRSGAGTGWEPDREWANPYGSRLRDALARAAATGGFARRRFDLEPAADALARVTARLDDLAATYGRLADEHSRALLVRLLVFRVLGPHHVELPVAAGDVAAARRRIAREARRPGDPVPTRYGPVDVYAARGRRGEVRLHADPMTVLEFFELEQYAYERPGAAVAPEPGDVVIDGGGAWGETALWFADAAGPDGRVVCAEFDAANLDVLRRNLALNPELAERIRLVEEALWSSSGERREYVPEGPSSSLVAPNRPGELASATTVTVDDLVERESLERVDFLKLDVEGAELDALRGAESTLRRFRPKLALAAYHSEDDLVELPAFLAGLGLGYELFLDHYTPGVEETTLFARHQRG